MNNDDGLVFAIITILIAFLLYIILSFVITTDEYNNKITDICLQNNYTEHERIVGIYPFSRLNDATCYNMVVIDVGGVNRLVKGKEAIIKVN